MHLSSSASSDFRYLPEEPEDHIWGIFLRDLGSAHIRPAGEYPPSGHPHGYHFKWSDGRVLAEYQFIFVRKGQGMLETRRAGRRMLRAGQVFVLFPGEWHRYRPSPATGWSEEWVGFNGEYAAHLMQHFFSPAEPVVSPADLGAVGKLMAHLCSAATEWTHAEGRAVLRTRLLELIAHLRRSRAAEADARAPGLTLESARLEILTRAAEKIDWRAMARRYGMGYATFRRRFKLMTGRSPLDYQIQVRLNRASEMLKRSDVSTREVAERLGYTHVHFFSRQFKTRFGKSPHGYRNR